MLPGSLVPETKHKPDHRASGCSPRRARPFGRAIEVFVASRDDDADYRNAVAQNASLHAVFPQETPFTFDLPTNSPNQKPPQPEVGDTLEAVLHRMTTRADGALMGPSPHAHAHPRDHLL